VHGRTELLRHDAVVVPTGPDLQVSRSWWPLLGGHDGWPPRSGWAGPGVRYGRGTDTVWFLDVDRPPGAGLPWLLDGVREVLEGIAAVVPCDPRRLLPLVVLPVLGIGAGGFGDDRGAVIRGLLDVADDVVHRHGVDIAFVTPDPACSGRCSTCAAGSGVGGWTRCWGRRR
jgi:hypothetical protein